MGCVANPLNNNSQSRFASHSPKAPLSGDNSLLTKNFGFIDSAFRCLLA
jgi:hypothetical protein